MAFSLIPSASNSLHLRADSSSLTPMLTFKLCMPSYRKISTLLISSTFLFPRPVFTDLTQRRAASQLSKGVAAFCKVAPVAPTPLSLCAWRKNFPQYQPFCSLSASGGGSSNMEPPMNNRSAALAETVANHMERPELDNRQYRVVQLPNKLEVLLIHDPDTDKASAALDVNAGSFSDAEDMPGLAHAVEHALFMGTEKYPGENDYGQYLTANSGYSNAFTASTSTNYFFEVAARSDANATTAKDARINKATSPLYGALDRFAQFFIAPLFNADTLDRELRAVDSENKKNLQSDTWRLYQLTKSLSNPEHPFHHFSTGNLQTLRDEPQARGVKIREAFMKFHDDHYSANRMKLVVLGQEPLDQLQEWVEELFAEVKNKDLPQNRWDGVAPLRKSDLLTQITAKPVMDSRSLEIYFPYQCEEEMYETQPARYLSHLIGHEGPGSVFAYVKNKGWANSLSAGHMSLCPGAALFTISIRLTQEGLANYKEVAKTVFQYISILRETPPQEWIVDEMKKMAEVDFRFRQKVPASSTTSGLSNTMQQPFPRDWLLSGPELIRKFDADAITNAVSYLRPDNFRLNVITQDPLNGTIQKEKWYGTEYTYEKLPEDFIEEIKKAANSTAKDRPTELYLPAKNEFIPTKLEVEKQTVAEPMRFPKLIRNEENVRTWYKKDDQFWVPKANLYITLRSPMASTTPQMGAMAQIYKDLVEDALVEYSYDADIAGLGYDVSVHSLGLDIVICGYNDKMPVLLEKVLTTMRNLEIKDDRFEIIKERLERGYRNYEFTIPYRQVGRYTSWLNREKGWIIEQYLAELPSIKAQDIRNFYPQLLQQTHIEVLAHGNLYREDALKATDLVENILRPRKLPASQWPIQRNLLLPEGSNFVYDRVLKDPANGNHCIEYYCSVGEVEDRQRYAELLLMGQMTEEPAFNQLRTKEQLGYVVFSGANNQGTTAGYRVLVQSEKSPEYLEKRIDAFLRQFKEQLRTMSKEDFEAHKRSLINKRLEKLKNLDQETGRFWTHITNEVFRFESVYEDAENIKRISKDDMVTFFDRYIDPSSKTRAKLSVHLLAQLSPEASATLSPEEQTSGVVSLVEKYLTSQGLEANMEKLRSRFQNIDLSSPNQDSLATSLTTYLKEDLNTAADTVTSVVENAKAAMASLLPSLKDQSALAETPLEADTPEPTIKNAIRIDSVHRFKASMPMSPGPAPVKDLTEFEDIESKL